MKMGGEYGVYDINYSVWENQHALGSFSPINNKLKGWRCQADQGNLSSL